MSESKKYLAVLAKAMLDSSSKNESFKDGFNSLFKLFNEDLKAILKDSDYPRGPLLTRSLNAMLDDMEALYNCTEVIGKGCVLIRSLKTNNLFKTCNSLFLNKSFVDSLYHVNTQIPFVIVNDSSDSIEIFNYANRRIRVSQEEFNLLVNESRQNKVGLNNIAQFFIIKTPLSNPDSCLIFDNVYQSAEAIFNRAICKKIMWIDSSEFKYKLSNFDAVSFAPYDEAEIANNIDLSKFNVLRLDDIDFYIKKKVKTVLYGFIDEYKLYESHVENFYLSSIEQAKSKVQDITKDIVKLGENADNNLRKLKKHSQFALDSLEQDYKKIKSIFPKVRELFNNIIPFLNDIPLSEKIIPRAIIDNEFKRLFTSIGHSKKTAREVLSRLILLKYEDCDLVSKYIQSFFCPSSNFEPIVISTKDWEKAKICIEMCDLQIISDIQLKQYIDALEDADISTAKEYYAKSRFLEGAQKYQALLKSFQLGYENAGDELMAMYHSGEKGVSFLSLVCSLIPEACFLQAELEQKVYDENTSNSDYVDLSSPRLTYYKIAATKLYLPAIQKIVDIIYSSRFSQVFHLQNKQKNDGRFKAVIVNGHELCNLCSYLLNKNYNVAHNTEIMGVVLYCLNDNLSGAMLALSGVNTAVANYCKAYMYEFGTGVAKDLNQALIHYHLAKDQECAIPNLSKRLVACERKIQKIEEHKNSSTSYNSSSNYRSSSYSSSKDVGWCFITTAICQALNAKDNCEELEILRAFRDNYLQRTTEGELLVREYYRIGPLITSEIDKLSDSNSLYKVLWNEYIKVCCEDITKGNFNDAKLTYISMVKKLCSRFNIAIKNNILEVC